MHRLDFEYSGGSTAYLSQSTATEGTSLIADMREELEALRLYKVTFLLGSPPVSPRIHFRQFY